MVEKEILKLVKCPWALFEDEEQSKSQYPWKQFSFKYYRTSIPLPKELFIVYEAFAFKGEHLSGVRVDL